MKAKGSCLRHLLDIDVFIQQVTETDPDKFIEVVAALNKRFGVV